MPIQTKAPLQGEKHDYEYIEKNIFWYPIYINSKDENKRVFKELKVDIIKFMDFLHRHGFRSISIQDNSIFIQIYNSKVIKPVDIKDIQEFVFNWLDDLPEFLDGNNEIKREMLTIKFIGGVAYYFNKNRLYYLRSRKPLVFNKCRIDNNYFYYNNGFVEVTAAGYKFKKYEELPAYIWESEILNRDFKEGTNTNDDTVDTFIKCVSDMGKPQRAKALRIAIGYYLHNYNDYKLKALVLTDGSSVEDEANGRTGKTLFCRLIGHMISADPFDPQIRTYCEIAGKQFDPKDPAKYSKAGNDTKLLVLNDLKENFKLDPIYNDITDFITVKQLYMNPFTIRPKIILTKNKSIDTSGASDRDRILEFEFSNYFTETHTPEKVFGHWMFTDWKDKHWHAYDLYMIECSRMFFANKGKLMQAEEINLSSRKLKEHTKPEFVEFMKNIWNPTSGEEYDAEDIFSKFQFHYKDYQNPRFKRSTFTGWLKRFCNYSPEWKNWSKSENSPRRKDSEGINYSSYILYKVKTKDNEE